MPRRSDSELLLDMLKMLGGAAGNKAMRQQLGWDEEKYQRVRNRLLASGNIVIGTGHGGSIRLSQKSIYTKEETLYHPLKISIQQGWGTDWDVDELTIEVTARGGKKSLGRWSKPDLCAVSRRSYKFQKHIDLWTFEVKPQGELSVDHVLEAVAHSRFSHRAYIMFHIEDKSLIHDNRFKRCLTEAERHKIGLVTFQDPTKYRNWHWHLEAVRKEPDPESLDDFIDQHLPQGMKEQILRWWL